MLVVMAIGERDREMALTTLRWSVELEPEIPHRLVLVVNRGTDTGALTEAAAGWRSVEVLEIDKPPGDGSWPVGANWAWQRTAKWVESGAPGANGWFWWEPDAIPTRAGWVSELERRWLEGGKPFAGVVVQREEGRYLAGVAVYQARTSGYLSHALRVLGQPFDIVGGLVDGNWKKATDLAAVLVHRVPGTDARNVCVNGANYKQLVGDGWLFHPSKDGALIRYLRKEEDSADFTTDFMGADSVSTRKLVQEWLDNRIVIRYQPVEVVWPVVRHVVERHSTEGDGRRRVEQALFSWCHHYRAGVVPRHYWNYVRRFTTSDGRTLPYLKDGLAEGLTEAAATDVVMLTNDDTVLHQRVVVEVLKQLEKRPAVGSHRSNFSGNLPALDGPPLADLPSDIGWDLFAFRAGWLRERFAEIPDFLLGELEWDLVMAFWLRREFGFTTELVSQQECDLPRGFVLHESHPPKWKALAGSDSRAYNLRLTKEFHSR